MNILVVVHNRTQVLGFDPWLAPPNHNLQSFPFSQSMFPSRTPRTTLQIHPAILCERIYLYLTKEPTTNVGCRLLDLTEIWGTRYSFFGNTLSVSIVLQKSTVIKERSNGTTSQKSTVIKERSNGTTSQKSTVIKERSNGTLLLRYNTTNHHHHHILSLQLWIQRRAAGE